MKATTGTTLNMPDTGSAKDVERRSEYLTGTRRNSCDT